MSKSLIMSLAAKEKYRLKKEGEDPEYDKLREEWDAMADKIYERFLEEELRESEHFGNLK